MSLKEQIESLFDLPAGELNDDARSVFAQFKQELNAGRVRAAEKQDDQWHVNTWVKKGILLGFRLGTLVDYSIDKHFHFYDKHTYPLKEIIPEDGVRIVPGGSSIRDGCYVGRGVTCMPPMYINAGSYIDDGTMVDSHALVGSCAQIGKRVHLSAAAQIGGVLEPVGSMPVIIEDDVLVGGNCGIYEGTIVRERAVIGAGTILTGSTPLFDIINNQIIKRTDDQPLVVPEGAVVVPGARAISSGWGRDMGLSLYAPIIVKYRDEKTDKSIKLEDILR
ncbi:MAG TPA: 2,3,4,5-tetrahydropyridine-2,6-dicarboxylate N-succinyltransferase [Blastocatellia bacterium]|nr:2,3,4,5-tetrahydropyridine-2,6-dicarboxylate N-succinyltransferase [Blastocatellia bacterium]